MDIESPTEDVVGVRAVGDYEVSAGIDRGVGDRDAMVHAHRVAREPPVVGRHQDIDLGSEGFDVLDEHFQLGRSRGQADKVERQSPQQRAPIGSRRLRQPVALETLEYEIIDPSLAPAGRLHCRQRMLALARRSDAALSLRRLSTARPPLVAAESTRGH